MIANSRRRIVLGGNALPRSLDPSVVGSIAAFHLPMKISAKAEYACLAILALARTSQEEAPVRIREIAESHNIPERYLVQILLQLKSSGLVMSTRGAAGGYRLARSPRLISLREVLEAIDGPAREREPSGPAGRALAAVWHDVRAAERVVLERTSIADLAESAAPREWVI